MSAKAWASLSPIICNRCPLPLWLRASQHGGAGGVFLSSMLAAFIWGDSRPAAIVFFPMLEF